MSARRRILIVEDDEYLRRASEIALTRAGYSVLSAPGGREGLTLARSERPDLIVLDLLMPRPTGLEILRTLKAEEETRAIPVLVVSNSSMQRIVDEVQALGAEYIVKAESSLRELLERVARRLAQGPEAPPAPPRPSARPVPLASLVERPASAELPPPEPRSDATMDCAGCGFPVAPRFAFCPKCGRRLARPPSPLQRRFR